LVFKVLGFCIWSCPQRILEFYRFNNRYKWL